MANRAMALKVERARNQRIELGNQEYFKPDYILAPKITHEELARLCDGVKVKRCEVGYARGSRKPKGAGVCERSHWIGKSSKPFSYGRL